MSIKNIIKNGIIIYAAYKFGLNKGMKKSSVSVNPIPKDLILNQEEYEVFELINSLKNKVNKSSKDKDNLELLEIKLKQLKKKI
jgi:hypothetical protein